MPRLAERCVPQRARRYTLALEESEDRWGEDDMLRRPVFGEGPEIPQARGGEHTCEATALTTEPTARNRAHFISELHACKDRALASPRRATDLQRLIACYAVCAAAERKSQAVIDTCD